MRSSMAAAAAVIVVSAPAVARAVDVPNSIKAPPSGAGSEQTPEVRARGDRVLAGVEASVGLGTGFSDTYGLGVRGRIGYAFTSGVYAGGSVDYYAGHSIDNESAHATFIGGEVGYKIFPSLRWEVRPYVFGGPAFIRTVDTNPLRTEQITAFALQPALLAAYHFGDVILAGDARYLITPSPTAFALFASAGFGF